VLVNITLNITKGSKAIDDAKRSLDDAISAYSIAIVDLGTAFGIENFKQSDDILHSIDHSKQRNEDHTQSLRMRLDALELNIQRTVSGWLSYLKVSYRCRREKC
jgi:hypothetical protein